MSTAQVPSRIRSLTVVCALIVALLLPLSLAGCSKKAVSEGSDTSESAEVTAQPLPEDSYYMQEGLEKWVDDESGYDTTRSWKLEGGEWPVMIVTSPSQAPQLILGMEEGIFQEKLEPHGVEPVMLQLDGPARVFHAMERSQWPFVYMPIAVFTDYSRSAANQGGAGGLQYVALAGSTAGGGYSLMAMEGVDSLEDLKGETIGLPNKNPAPGTLLTKAAEEAGIAIGDGPEDIRIAFGEGGSQLDKFESGEYKAVVTLNVLKPQLLDRGAHVVTDFSDVDYLKNYTILCVERTVLEQRPEVVKSFLEAHYEGHQLAEETWDTTAMQALMNSWNAFFETQVDKTPWAKDRIMPNLDAFKLMLGDMWPEQRLDTRFLADCFAFNARYGNWEWNGSVDTSKLVNTELYNEVLTAHGEEPQ